MIVPGHVNSLNYCFACRDCNLYRVVRRDNLPPPESLLRSYIFHCQDITVECHETARARWSFSPTCDLPGIGAAPSFEPLSHSRATAPASQLRDSQMSVPFSPSSDPERWRKGMRTWAGAVTYDGSASLVQLRGWENSLKEAFETVGVPQGRPQVLQGVQYLRGEAEKWWRSVAGQPIGTMLVSFDLLSEALQKRFIRCSVYSQAIQQ